LLTGQPSFSDTELFSLPDWKVLELSIQLTIQFFQYTASVDFGTPLVHLILRQFHTYPVEVLTSQIEAMHAILSTRCQSVIDFRDASTPSLSPFLYQSIIL